MDAACYCGVVGPTAAGWWHPGGSCNWRRTLCQRTGKHALIVDDLRFRTSSRNMKVTTTWQSPGAFDEGAGRPRGGFRVAIVRRAGNRWTRPGDHDLERRGRQGRSPHRFLLDRAKRADAREARCGGWLSAALQPLP